MQSTCNIITCSSIFINKIGPGTHRDPKFGRKGGVSYIDAKKKRFRNAVQAYALLRKNFRNGVPARPVTKVALVV
jgi:hypothetical protein